MCGWNYEMFGQMMIRDIQLEIQMKANDVIKCESSIWMKKLQLLTIVINNCTSNSKKCKVKKIKAKYKTSKPFTDNGRHL